MCDDYCCNEEYEDEEVETLKVAGAANLGRVHVDSNARARLVKEFDNPYDATIREEVIMSPEDKLEFISLLLANDKGAIAAVESFLKALREEDRMTASTQTIWFKSVQDEYGFYRYTINHGLGAHRVGVEVEDTKAFVFSVTDPDTVVISSPDDLWGVEVYVEVL